MFRITRLKTAHEAFRLVLKKVHRSTALLHWEVANEKAFFHPSWKHLRSDATADHVQEQNIRHYTQTPCYYRSKPAITMSLQLHSFHLLRAESPLFCIGLLWDGPLFPPFCCPVPVFQLKRRAPPRGQYFRSVKSMNRRKK